MAEWWDDFKEEMAWPFVQARNWYEESSDNQTAFWLTTIATCVLTCIIYTGVGLGLRAAVRALSNDATITVVSGNPCLTNKGLVREFAPAPCYDSGHKHEVVMPAATEQETHTGHEGVEKAYAVYNPPCKKDGLLGCSDQIYGKRLVDGIVDTVTFNTDEKQTQDNHLQPDYTEVKFLSEHTDEEPPNSEKFCGNVLNRFTPGRRFKMVINESKQADYNGCYTIDVVVLTFGGSPYARRK
jgi:hypothetical protein